MKLVRGVSGKLPIAVVVVVALLLGLALGGLAILKFRQPAGKVEKKVELTQWKLDEFIVNLADREEARYLKVNIVLEIEGKAPASGGGHGDGGGSSIEDARTRDAIITVISRKFYQELLSEDGKTKLKEDLKSALNPSSESEESGESVNSCKVCNIYFTSFAMQ